MQHRRVEFVLAAMALFSCLYFFQGGGWNQNAHFITTVSLVEHHTLAIDRYSKSSGDLAIAHLGGKEVLVSGKALGTALLAVFGYLVASLFTSIVDNASDRVILRAYGTTFLTSGVALAILIVTFYRIFCRRLDPKEAAFLSLAFVFGTPLFPNATMLSQHVLTAVFTLSSYSILERHRFDGTVPKPNRLFLAGALAAMAPFMEYQAAPNLLILALYALSVCMPWRRAFWFGLGAFLILLLPMTHHTIVYGHPLKTGYSTLATAAFAAIHGQGALGFDMFKPWRLYELTFGTARGAFLLSPFLLAGFMGLGRLLRREETRAEGLVTGSIAWSTLILIASFIQWHSGSATGSRYALPFVVFSCVPVAAAYRRARRSIIVGVLASFFLMLMATAVTALPPPPGPSHNVIDFWWERFSRGELASWREPVLIDSESPAVAPTLPYAFNLGQLMGLSGLSSLIPFAIGFGVLGALLRQSTRSLEAALFSAEPPPGRR